MAKKIVIDQFTGVTPRVPNHALSERAASTAINARLSDSTIRPFYEPVDSSDTNSDLSGNFNGYTNFFKASTETALAWMSWTVDSNVSILEVRYNDIAAYDYPEPLEATLQAGEDLNVLLSGTRVILKADGTYTASYYHLVESNSTPTVQTLSNVTVSVTADVEVELAAISTYAWAYVSGDNTITIDDNAIQTPTFTCPSLSAPAVINTNSTKEAVWRVTITDVSANVGTRDVTVKYTYRWKRLKTQYAGGQFGGGGGTIENGEYQQFN